MIKLIVEGQQLDLFKNEVFAITKAVAKIGDINLRHGDVSINFKVPATAKNNLIFRYIANLNNNNIGAFKRFEGVVLDGQSVVSRGYYQVLKTKPLKKEIELRFYGGNSDWFDLIKDRSINKTYPNTSNSPNSNSYDLSFLNHKYDTQSIVNSWDNLDGYTYFPIDNGANSNKGNNIFENSDFQVGVFTHTIMENILSSVNIKLAGNILNDPLYYNTLVNLPSDLDDFKSLNNSKSYRQATGTPIEKLNYNPIIFDLNDQDTQWNGNTFTANSDINTFKFKLKYLATHSLFYGNDYGDLEVKCQYTINGIPQTDIETILTIKDSTQGFQLLLVDFQEEEYNFSSVKQGDTFAFSIKNVNYNTPGIQKFWFSQSQFNSSALSAYLKYDITGSNTAYDITDVLPEINQSKFVQDVMFRFGSISQYDAANRTLSIDKFDIIEDNKVKGIDFTKKVDLSKGIDIDFTKLLQKYFKTTYIKYLEDDKDLYNILNKQIFKTGLGDGEINIDNDNLSSEGTIYQSVFSATSQIWTFNNNFYFPTMSLFSGSGEPNDLKPRLLVNSGKIPVTQFNKGGYDRIVLDGNDYFDVGYAFFAKERIEESGVTDLGLNSNLDTLSFQHYGDNGDNAKGSAYMGNTLLDKYYNLQNSILNTPIFLSINLNLNDLDIESIDFLVPIWIETQVDSGWYYINEISQYKGDGSTTKINLVKI